MVSKKLKIHLYWMHVAGDSDIIIYHLRGHTPKHIQIRLPSYQIVYFVTARCGKACFFVIIYRNFYYEYHSTRKVNLFCVNIGRMRRHSCHINRPRIHCSECRHNEAVIEFLTIPGGLACNSRARKFHQIREIARFFGQFDNLFTFFPLCELYRAVGGMEVKKPRLVWRFIRSICWARSQITQFFRPTLNFLLSSTECYSHIRLIELKKKNR